MSALPPKADIFGGGVRGPLMALSCRVGVAARQFRTLIGIVDGDIEICGARWDECYRLEL